MNILVRNETEYPDREVRDIVLRELRSVELRGHGVLVDVKYTTQTKRRVAASQGDEYWLNPHSGEAYDYVPGDMLPYRGPRVRFAVKLRIADPYSGAFPMRRAAWRYGWEDTPRKRGEFPLFQCRTWQEALVEIAAHEARHLEDYAWHRPAGNGGRQAELTCELHAAKQLTHYRTKGGTTVPDKENTGAAENGVKSDLLEAIKGIDGVSFVEQPSYTTVKHGKTTLGYVTGKRKVRVDFPMRGGSRANVIVKSAADVSKVVTEMETFVPPLERTAKPDPKPAGKKASSKKASDKKDEGGESTEAATPAS